MTCGYREKAELPLARPLTAQQLGQVPYRAYALGKPVPGVQALPSTTQHQDTDPQHAAINAGFWGDL